jgi:hypothetical protein
MGTCRGSRAVGLHDNQLFLVRSAKRATSCSAVKTSEEFRLGSASATARLSNAPVYPSSCSKYHFSA